jgi:hypothetical protein
MLQHKAVVSGREGRVRSVENHGSVVRRHRHCRRSQVLRHRLGRGVVIAHLPGSESARKRQCGASNSFLQFAPSKCREIPRFSRDKLQRAAISRDTLQSAECILTGNAPRRGDRLPPKTKGPPPQSKRSSGLSELCPAARERTSGLGSQAPVPTDSAMAPDAVHAGDAAPPANHFN